MSIVIWIIFEPAYFACCGMQNNENFSKAQLYSLFTLNSKLLIKSYKGKLNEAMVFLNDVLFAPRHDNLTTRLRKSKLRFGLTEFSSKF